jgi:glycosyltransferase involved in cell wall biosynthesis
MAMDVISLIVPTRGRPEQLRRLLDSLAQTTAAPDALEVILVIDHDDAITQQIADERLILRRVVVPPGLSMGELNSLGYEASRGRYVMLLNDDVIARTPAWDKAVRGVFAAHDDDIVLVHVNDLVFERHLCTFPIVSRTFCELVGGICPREYRRYRIDDHIEDYFNLLNVLGFRRTVFVPHVVFEHHNYTTNESGVRQYFCDPALLAPDARLYERLFTERKELALQLVRHITGRAVSWRWRRKLARIEDPFGLRIPGRQRILTEQGIVDACAPGPTTALWRRAARCLREKGAVGLVRAVGRRLLRFG